MGVPLWDAELRLTLSLLEQLCSHSKADNDADTRGYPMTSNATISVIWHTAERIEVHVESDQGASALAMPGEVATRLGRSLLVAGTQSDTSLLQVEPGTVMSDGSLEVEQFRIGFHADTGAPVIILTIAHGVQMTFHMSAEGAQVAGHALQAAGLQAQGQRPKSH